MATSDNTVPIVMTLDEARTVWRLLLPFLRLDEQQIEAAGVLLGDLTPGEPKAS